jgi:hypothetical protein
MLPETINTRGVHVGLRFAPPALLDKQHKQQFQMKCSEGFDWRRQEYTETGWFLTSPQAEGDPRSQLKLSFHPDRMTFEDFFPTAPLDVFFDNLKLILDCVDAVFNPRLLVGSGATIRLTAQAEGGDSRVFLGQKCLQLDDRLAPLGRPVHAVGFKMLLPPLPGKDKPNWQADVKIECLVEDVRQLYLEVDAQWMNPVQWDHNTIVERIRTAHDFLTTRVVEFMKGFAR